ncbi:MAG: toxin-antitoxin system HicB family antitoxin [Nitrosotalea sp.]
MNKIDQKKESFTLRINAESIDLIKENAHKENVSVNQFINRLLDTAVYWNLHARSAGWIPMPKQILLELIKKSSDAEIEELADKLGKQIAKDILLFTDKKYDVDSWIDFLRIRSQVSGFEFTEHKEDNIIKCIIHHSMGKKWSIWFQRFYNNVMTDMNAKVKFEISENIISMTIQK